MRLRPGPAWKRPWAPGAHGCTAGARKGLYPDTDHVQVSACSLRHPDDPAVFVAIRIEPAENPTLSLGTRVEMERHKAPPHAETP